LLLRGVDPLITEVCGDGDETSGSVRQHPQKNWRVQVRRRVKQ